MTIKNAPCIYKLVFSGTDRVYIGKTVNISNRRRSYTYNYKNKVLPKKLLDAYEKYGIPDMVVEKYATEHELETLEAEYIEKYNSVENGFNSRRATHGKGTGHAGEANGRAIYSNDQIVELAEYLAYTDLTYPEISKILHISLPCISQVAVGLRHNWLITKFPELWEDLVNNKRNIGTKFTTNNYIINLKTEEETLITCVEDLIQLTGCKYSTATSFLRGLNKTLFNTWKLKNKIEKVHIKKPTYTIYNSTLDIMYSSSSISGMCIKYNIPNRPKFTEFLKSNPSVDSEYLGWCLLHQE